MFVMVTVTSRVIASDLPAKAWQAGAWQSLRLLRLTKVSLAKTGGRDCGACSEAQARNLAPRNDRERIVTNGLNEDNCFHCGVIRDIIETRGNKNKRTLTEG